MNYKELPASLVGTLFIGLRADSRIKMKMTGTKVPSDILLLASAVDRLSMLVYAQTKDAQKNINKPKLLVPVLLGEQEKIKGFVTGNAFEEARRIIIGGE